MRLSRWRSILFSIGTGESDGRMAMGSRYFEPLIPEHSGKLASKVALVFVNLA